MKMMLPAIAAILYALPQARATQIDIQPSPEPDPAPAAIAGLAVIDPSETSITLTWAAPIDTSPKSDTIEVGAAIGGIGGIGIINITGPAKAYDLRYSRVSPKAGDEGLWWGAATPVADDDGMLPQAPGTTEYLTLYGLDPATTYYFAIKSRDDVSVNHWSALSNIAPGSTLALLPEAPPPPPGPPGKPADGGCGGSATGHATAAILGIAALVLRRR